MFSETFKGQHALNLTCISTCVKGCLPAHMCTHSSTTISQLSFAEHMPQPLTLPTPTIARKPTYRKLCSRVKEQPKYPLFPQIPSTHRRTRFHTRSTCVPLYWPSLLLFLNGILKAMFTAKLCALWSVQERQQILKYWLLSLLEERASSRREREADMGGKDRHGQTDK